MSSSTNLIVYAACDTSADPGQSYVSVKAGCYHTKERYDRAKRAEDSLIIDGPSVAMSPVTKAIRETSRGTRTKLKDVIFDPCQTGGGTCSLSYRIFDNDYHIKLYGTVTCYHNHTISFNYGFRVRDTVSFTFLRPASGADREIGDRIRKKLQIGSFTTCACARPDCEAPFITVVTDIGLQLDISYNDDFSQQTVVFTDSNHAGNTRQWKNKIVGNKIITRQSESKQALSLNHRLGGAKHGEGSPTESG